MHQSAPLPKRPRPELAHRLVGLARVGHVVAAAIVRLDREPQPVLVRQLAEAARVVLHHQLRDRLPQVPQEPLGHFQAVHHPPRHHRQEGQGIVAAQPSELLAEGRRPVLRADFPAINVRRHQRLARQRLGVRDQLAHEPVEHRVRRLPAQLVALQSPAIERRGMIVLARRRMAEAHHGPLAGRHIPHQPAILGHLRRQLPDAAARDRLLRRQRLRQLLRTAPPAG